MQVGDLVNKTINTIEQSCCKRQVEESSVLKMAKIVARVAIGLLCITVAPEVFVPFFLGGAIWAFYQVAQNREFLTIKDSNGGCTQLYLESLAGLKLPAEASFFFNTAIQIFHVIVCPVVFGSYASAVLGGFAGREVALAYEGMRQKGFQTAG